MTDITLIQAVDWLARFCLFFSILYAILPPYEIFDDYPGFQKFYKLVLGLVKHFAINVRDKMNNLYPSFNRSIMGQAAQEQKVADINKEIDDANKK